MMLAVWRSFILRLTHWQGWYHGAALTEPQLEPLLFPPLQEPRIVQDSADRVLQLVNPLYHVPAEVLVRKMRKRGAVACSSFLADNVIRIEEFANQSWHDVGPLHLRYYQRCSQPTGSLKRMRDLLCGSSFLRWAEQLVGVHMSLSSVELRRFV
jgi:hypothetical protein